MKIKNTEKRQGSRKKNIENNSFAIHKIESIKTQIDRQVNIDNEKQAFWCT